MSNSKTSDVAGVPESALASRLKHYRLSETEYHKICELLGRAPEGVEWAVFSALWSEHCSYKSTRIHLRKFARTITQKVLNAAGENAGVVDLGQGERVAFKMESHNHPSFLEPFQGAATGVGGILRDIFTMGARPLALLNFLCFGEVGAKRGRELVDGVVRGIGSYGNCVGVPTVGGRTHFHSAYNSNILVNAMAVGLLRESDPIALSKAQGPGNWIVYVGAKTGKDGVHGAAMASESFGVNLEAKKPNVQVGDPYYEKLLIEACLEVISANLVVAIQDMGAAGLTSSSFEMASKGRVGMKLDLSRIPLRDQSLTPEEILLSESQERMLLVIEPRNWQKLKEVFSHWQLDAAVVGEVIAERMVELHWQGKVLTRMNPDWVVEEAPMYERPWQISPPAQGLQQQRHGQLGSKPPEPSQQLGSKPPEPLEFLRMDARFVDKGFIFEQFDQRVGASTVHGADFDVAILRLKGSGRGLCMAVGCRPEWMELDPVQGSADALLYPMAQMALKGATPQAVTDCLNFANPEKPEVMGTLVAAVDVITKFCVELKTPVISGNVSLYNETLGKGILPTPAIGVVGLRSQSAGLSKPPLATSAEVLTKPWAYLPGDRLDRGGAKIFILHSPPSVLLDPNLASRWLQNLRDVSVSAGVVATQMIGSLGGLATLLKMTTEDFGFELSDSGFQAVVESHLGVPRVDGFFYSSVVVVDPVFHSNQQALDQWAKTSGLVEVGVSVLGSFSRAKARSWSYNDINLARRSRWKEICAELS